MSTSDSYSYKLNTEKEDITSIMKIVYAITFPLLVTKYAHSLIFDKIDYNEAIKVDKLMNKHRIVFATGLIHIVYRPVALYCTWLWLVKPIIWNE